MTDWLLGAAMSSPAKVANPAWFGSPCWVMYTSMSSDLADCMVLMPVVHAAILPAQRLLPAWL